MYIERYSVYRERSGYAYVYRLVKLADRVKRTFSSIFGDLNYVEC